MSEPEKSAQSTSASDEQLMTAYVEGNQDAFRQLFSRYAPLLARIVHAKLASDEESRDLVQQTFLQLHRARNDYRAGEPLRPWLLTIAYNLIRDRWRTLGRRREEPLELAPPQIDADTPADVLQRRRRAERLHAALTALSPDQRQVVELHWFGGVPLPEVATTLGVSLSAVKVRAYRAYTRLRENLDLGREV
jgi:RNA polymerase sigma-70 factor (ECF subfamily)